MATYAWATDTHLDLLANNTQAVIHFAESLVAQNPTGIFLTGDIATAKSLVYNLSAIERVVQRPVYFVLGNHDYYGGNTEQVRKTMRELTNASPFLRYMPTMQYYALSPATAVIGHDGWYDALYGDFNNSNFSMNDWTAIQDFAQVNGNKATVATVARKLAKESTMFVHDAIKKAVRYHKNIVILTHVPPFAEAHMHLGKPGEPTAMPWFTSKMMGDMLRDAANAFPTVNFTILAGHTHGKADVKIAPNLTCHVGGAEYYKPMLQGTLEVA
jgi:predicted MPP superfamily phosphohydrolase